MGAPRGNDFLIAALGSGSKRASALFGAQVELVSITAGSIIVEFRILPGYDSTPIEVSAVSGGLVVGVMIAEAMVRGQQPSFCLLGRLCARED